MEYDAIPTPQHGLLCSAQESEQTRNETNHRTSPSLGAGASSGTSTLGGLEDFEGFDFD